MRSDRLLLSLVALLVACPTAGDDDDAVVPDDDDTPDFGDDDDSGDDDDATPAPIESLDDVLAVLETSGDAAEVDALLHEVAWRWSWPLEDGGRWLFATRWEGAESLSVAGDINAWDPTATPGTAAATGVHWYAVVQGSDFDVPAQGAKYKWTDGSAWGAPRATAYGYDENGLFGWVVPPSDRAWLERFPDLTTSALPLPRAVRVLLPAGFSTASAGSARTLLMHDGQNLVNPEASYGGWEMDALLAADPAYDDVVLVAVDNSADRLDVYSPVQDAPFEGNPAVYGGRADEYLDLLDENVLPFVRERYGIVADGPSLMVAGSSMGGLVSLYIAQQWDGGFGCVGALSPTLSFGAFVADGTEALVNTWPVAPGHGSIPVFLYNGGDDFPGCADHDGDGVQELTGGPDNYCVTTQFRDMLAAQGYAFEDDLWHWWEPNAPHLEPSWRAQVPRMLESCAASGWSAPQ